jgi:hypothetical protein
MGITRRLRRTAMAMAIGAGMAYFLDPVQGPDRRREAAGTLRSMAESRGPVEGSAGGGSVADGWPSSEEVPSGSPFERSAPPQGANADPTGGAAPIQGRPTLHSTDVMG